MSDGQRVLTAWNKINLVRGFNDGILNSSQKFLLVLLATHIGEHEYCFTSLTTLAHECMLTRANVNINLKKLISLGYVKKIPPSNGYKSNRYGIDLVKLASIETIPLPKKVVSQQYQPSIETIPDQYRSDTTLVSERYPNRNIKEKLKNSERGSQVVSPENQEQKQEQKLYTKKTFTYTHTEAAEAIARDFDIQKCVNAFVQHLFSQGREEFARSEWEAWFAREWGGQSRRGGYRGGGERDAMCGRCNRPSKGCYCDRQHERPMITGMEKQNGLSHVGKLI